MKRKLWVSLFKASLYPKYLQKGWSFLLFFFFQHTTSFLCLVWWYRSLEIAIYLVFFWPQYSCLLHSIACVPQIEMIVLYATLMLVYKCRFRTADRHPCSGSQVMFCGWTAPINITRCISEALFPEWPSHNVSDASPATLAKLFSLVIHSSVVEGCFFSGNGDIFLARQSHA